MGWPMVNELSLEPQDTCSRSCDEKNKRPVPAHVVPAHAQPCPRQSLPFSHPSPTAMECPPPPENDANLKAETPRILRNKAEKERRDKMSNSIKELSSIVPPVLAMKRKIDKTSVLRLAAHYLRSHQYVFGDSINTAQQFRPSSALALMSLLKGFIITTTYKGLVVVISPNVQEYLGYTELDLIGRNIVNIIHEDDRQMMLDKLIPNTYVVGPNDEILYPDDPESIQKVADALAKERRSFTVRFKKSGKREYINCHIQGSFRKSDRASRSFNRCNQMVRRLRGRGRNWSTSGNDVVFIGLVRPAFNTISNESKLNSSLMEYRTRHSVDGEIIQCDSSISLVTGYMTHEVRGINAMNFMHRDDVRWVIVALREMYDQHRLSGESCYRLMTKCGKFVYMRTRGFLEVEKATGAVTSFVCINTVVEKEEGRHLNTQMKKKYMLLVHNTDETPPEDDDEEVNDSQVLPVEDPRQLRKVILHLVTNLPSPHPETFKASSPFQEELLPNRLSIIPPKKERIVGAIDKIYSVIHTFRNRSPPREHREEIKEEKTSNYLETEKEFVKVMDHKPSGYEISNNDSYIDVPSVSSFSSSHTTSDGTTNYTSPEPDLLGFQRFINPLVIQRLHTTEPEHSKNLSPYTYGIADNIKTYTMNENPVADSTISEPSTTFSANYYAQTFSPTTTLGVTHTVTSNTNNRYHPYKELWSHNMEQPNRSSLKHGGSYSEPTCTVTSSSQPTEVNLDWYNNNTPENSNAAVCPFTRTPFYDDYYGITDVPPSSPVELNEISSTWDIPTTQVIQAGPSTSNYNITPFENPVDPPMQEDVFSEFVSLNPFEDYIPQPKVGVKRHCDTTETDEVPNKRATIDAYEYIDQDNSLLSGFDLLSYQRDEPTTQTLDEWMEAQCYLHFGPGPGESNETQNGDQDSNQNVSAEHIQEAMMYLCEKIGFAQEAEDNMDVD